MAVKVTREMVVRAVSVILRVPSLFIAEACYRTNPQTVHDMYAGRGRAIDPTHQLIIQMMYYSGETPAFSSILTLHCEQCVRQSSQSWMT